MFFDDAESLLTEAYGFDSALRRIAREHCREDRTQPSGESFNR